MSKNTSVVTIGCPMSRPEGWSCEGTLTVRVTGRYVPARGFAPADLPEFEIVKQTCDCDPLAIDSQRLFEERVAEALAGWP